MTGEEGQTTQAVAPRVVSEPPVRMTVAPSPVLQSSDGVADIITALCAAQLKFKAVAKDRVADITSSRGSYKYGYATLAAVIAAVRPALNENGIALVQSANVVNGERAVMLQVDTRFLHTSGQWIGSLLRLPLSDATPQGMGSLLTYLRRYGLSALAGVASEEDDDAQLAQALTPPPTPQRSRATAPKPPTVRQDIGDPPPPGAPPEPTVDKPKPVAKAKPPAVPLGGEGTITSRDRAQLFATAKKFAWTEADVKSLIKQLFSYESTSQLTALQLSTVLGSIEYPTDYGVSFENVEGQRVVVVRREETL
jgi:hypothetical protein